MAIFQLILTLQKKGDIASSDWQGRTTRAQRASVARGEFVRVTMAESGASTACTEPEHRRPELCDVKYETKDWRWLLWDSDVARKKIHPELGAGWTAVLQDALHAADPPPSPVSRRMPRTSATTTVGVLRWARENGCPWDEKTCYCAAMEGNLDVLKYAHENGCPWDEWTCSNAAKGGHMNVLEYAHENGCPWEEFTCYSAAKGGHLDVLKYLHENGCPWNRYACVEAAKGGHLDVLKYTHENMCLELWLLRHCRQRAVLEGQRAAGVVAWIDDLYPKLVETFPPYLSSLPPSI